MRGFYVVAILIAVVALCADAVQPLYEGKGKTALPKVGVSLQPIIGVSASCPWINLMRCAPVLTVTSANGGWVNPGLFPLRPDGYPLGLVNQRARTVLQSGLDGHYAAGQYVLSFSGNGTVSVGGDAAAANISSAGPQVQKSFLVSSPSAAGILLTIVESRHSDPVRDIVVKLGSLASETSRWNPTWLKLVKEFPIIRFAHWQQEYRDVYGNQTIYGWNERPSQATYTQVQPRGVAHEEIAQLASSEGLDLFLSIPQRANDDYIRQMAALYLATGRNVVLEESHKIGWIADPSVWRIPRLKKIRSIWDAVWVGASNTYQLVITCDLLCAEYTPFLEPSHKNYDSAFRQVIDAIAISGESFSGAEYEKLGPIAGDVQRVVWEQMLTDESNLFEFISRMALLDLPVYAYEGGVLLAVDMYGRRFTDRNSSEAATQYLLEANFWKTERSNDPMLHNLWLEWMERWYRNGGSLFIAGQLISQGIECKFADTQIINANRWQCNYRGLMRYIEDDSVSPKMIAVRKWVNHTSSEIDELLSSPPQPAEPTCQGTCVWGDCDTTGQCKCHNGYRGRQCDVFDASLLPNGCSPPDYGVNVGGGADWEPIWYWTNFMNFAREWGFQPVVQVNPDKYGWIWDYRSSTSYPANPFPELTEDGYPKRLLPNDAVNTFLRRDTYEYPHGIFHVIYSGEGILNFAMDTFLVRRVSNGHYIVETRPSRGLNNGLWFQIRRTNPDDPIRDIKVVPASQFPLNYRWQTFHPMFLDSMKRYRVIRFMNLQLAHEDNVTAWAHRTTPTYYSQAAKDGVSIEHVVQLSNVLHIRPWINIPYEASDEYVASQADYVRENLNPRLTPIVEYSNEVWASHHNVGFYAATQGVKSGLASGTDSVVARSCWVQKRSREIWRIYQSKGVNITRVLCGQAVQTRVLREALVCQPNVSLEVDALAIAPYFGVPLSDAASGTATLNEVFDMIPQAINVTAKFVADHMKLAREFQVPAVFTYEAGPSFYGGAKAEDPDVMNIGVQVHRDARMAGTIKQYFDALRDAGSTVNAYFVGPAGKWSQYGAFGMREYQNQDPVEAIKYLGYAEYARNNSCVAVPDPTGCPKRCSGHGACLPNAVCECYMSWRGVACEEKWRIPDYNGCNKYTCEKKGGSCKITATDGYYDLTSCANCTGGWVGWACQIAVCTQNCSFNGKCTAPGVCQCFRGHSGAICSVDCGCNGRGVCSGNGGCNCDAGYKFVGGRCSPVCNCSACLAPGVCDCALPCVYGACWAGTCTCWDGFSGPQCQNISSTKSKGFDAPLGINLAGIADWTSSTEMLNYMSRARDWFLQPAGTWVQNIGYRWAINEPVTLTRDGYPAFLPYNRKASTFIMRDTMYIPSGRYVMLWEGQGSIELAFGAVPVPETVASGYMEVQYTPSTVRDNGFFISITATNPSNPIRNIRVYSPIFPHDAYAKKFIFHPSFLADVRPFRVLRFMNWFNLGRIAPNSTRVWRNRKRPDDASMHTGFGVSEEVMVALCNWVGSEPWITVPHDADDDYVRNLASLLYYRLRPDLGIHIEHSNEVWNQAFESFTYAAKRGRKEFPTVSNDGEAAALWHGLRSQQIFDIFADVFGELQSDRLHFKLGTFTLSTWHTAKSLSLVTSRPLAVAITTYFCDERTFGGPAAAAFKSVSELTSMCRADANKSSTFSAIAKHVQFARDRGLSIESYEGGPSLVQYSAMMGGYPQPGVEELYRSFHTNSEMKSIVQLYYTAFRRIGVEFTNYFTSAAKGSIYGHWGIKESTAQTCESSAKCSGTAAWIDANRNGTAREATWAMSDYGIYNQLNLDFDFVPLPSQLKQMIKLTETQLAMPTGSISWKWLTNASSPNPNARRMNAEAMSSTSVALTLRIGMSRSQADVSKIMKNLELTIPVKAFAAGLADVTVSLYQPASIITPSVPLPPLVADDPTAKAPKTPRPTTKAPATNRPIARPTTQRPPTQRPTTKPPTQRPTTKPPTQRPTTKRPAV